MIFCFIWAIFHFISGNILGFAAATQQHATFGWAIASVNYIFKNSLKPSIYSFSHSQQCVFMVLIPT